MLPHFSESRSTSKDPVSNIRPRHFVGSTGRSGEEDVIVSGHASSAGGDKSSLCFKTSNAKRAATGTITFGYDSVWDFPSHPL